MYGPVSRNLVTGKAICMVNSLLTQFQRFHQSLDGSRNMTLRDRAGLNKIDWMCFEKFEGGLLFVD
jgi:hypothetical protein